VRGVAAGAIGLCPAGDAALSAEARVLETLYLGEVVQVTCEVDGAGPVQAAIPASEATGVAIDRSVRLYIDSRRAVAVGE
jgi:hypothetical protein